MDFDDFEGYEGYDRRFDDVDPLNPPVLFFERPGTRSELAQQFSETGKPAG